MATGMADIGLAFHQIPAVLVRCVCALYYTIYLSILQIYHCLYPPPGKSLKEKHVLVTGAGGALGRLLALRFAKEGCHVTCVDVNLPECQETVNLVSMLSECSKDKARCYLLDITDRAAVSDFAKKLEVEVGPVDILVNNAGIVQAGGLLQATEDQISKIIDVNLMGQFWTIKAFLPTMMERNTGHIVAISSLAALGVASNIATYTASKAGVSALMSCLREEIRKLQACIYTTTVQPYFLAPPQGKKHWEVKSMFPDITAEYVANCTVDAIKRNTVTVTLPTYLYFTMYLVRLLPAAASDMWRDALPVTIDSLNTKPKAEKTN